VRRSRLDKLARQLFAVLALGIIFFASAPATFGQTSQDRVLILSTTVANGTASIEASKAASLGFAVDIVTPAQWAVLTTSDFARYRAIILGDPLGGGPEAYAAAAANADVWSPVVNGNVVAIGVDTAFIAQFGSHLALIEPHAAAAAKLLSDNAVARATAIAGATGAYISLSTSLLGEGPAIKPVPVLSGFGQFTGTPGETDVVRIIDAASPILAGQTQASLSNWHVSIMEVFLTWPSSFRPVAADAAGNPYILSRGPTFPTSRQQCKDQGWRNYGDTFRNQGQCVAFVERGPKPKP
jgi:hypothetical protein